MQLIKKFESLTNEQLDHISLEDLKARYHALRTHHEAETRVLLFEMGDLLKLADMLQQEHSLDRVTVLSDDEIRLYKMTTAAARKICSYELCSECNHPFDRHYMHQYERGCEGCDCGQRIGR